MNEIVLFRTGKLVAATSTEVGDESAVVGEGVFFIRDGFPDADYLLDPENRVIGFSFNLGGDEALLHSNSMESENVDLSGSLLRVFLKHSPTCQIEVVQLVGASLLQNKLGEYAVAIPGVEIHRLACDLL